MSDDEDEDRSLPPKRAVWYRYTDASSVGIEMAVAVSVGALAGYYVERYLTHWSPWTMLIGFAFGVMAAVRAVTRTASNYQATLRADAAREAARAKADDDTASTAAPERAAPADDPDDPARGRDLGSHASADREKHP